MKAFYFKTAFMAIGLVMLTCITSCSKDDSAEDTIEEAEALSIAEEILQLVNSHRAGIGKQPLQMNSLATTLASEHTEYMIVQADISHDDFDKRADRLFSDENATNVGENVAYGQRSASHVMEAWLNSPGHRKNIEGDFTHIGIAVIKNASGTYYFTQLFLKKRVNQ